jgi:PqqD family protein of HPr-rel-A system
MTGRPTIADGRIGVIPADKLVWADWESDSSVYNRGTGETHLLSVLPAEIARALAVSPMAFADLCQLMAKRCETDNTPAWREKLTGILLDLRDLDIVNHIIDGH